MSLKKVTNAARLQQPQQLTETGIITEHTAFDKAQ